jgi:MYXO-CTERM domain-containing protein
MAARVPFRPGSPARIPAVAACAALILCSQPAALFAYCRLKAGEEVAGDECSEGGVPLTWKQRCISYAVFPPESGDPPLEDALEAIDASFDSWLAVRCEGLPLDLEVERLKELSRCSVPEHNPDGPNLNSIAFVSDWLSREDHPPEAFALTSVWHDRTTGEILDVDMELNQDPKLARFLGEFGICPRESGQEPEKCAVKGLVDIQNVVTHEAGHFLGLGHSKDPQSVMRPQAETDDLSKRTLAPDDVEGICSVYPPGSMPEQCDFTPRNGLSFDCYQRANATGCGCAAAGAPGTGSRTWALAALLLGTALLRRRPPRRASRTTS